MTMIKAALILFFSCSVFAQTAPEMEATLQKHPDQLSTRLQLGNYYLKQKSYDRVIELLNSYTDQLTAQGFLTLASAYSSKKDYLNEARVLNLLALKQPADFHWHLLLGQAYLKQVSQNADPEKKRDIATQGIKELRQALKLQPKFKPAFDALLVALLQQKANNDARELLNEGVHIYGERPELYRELCRLDAADGFLGSAIKNCRRGIKIAPNYPDNYVFLIQALYDQKEQTRAESEASSAARKFPNSEFVQWAAGTLFFKRKNYPVARRYFAAATKADPNSSRAHFGLAQAMFESGEEQSSYEHFLFACKHDPKSIDKFLEAGGRLKQKGQQSLGDKFVSSAYGCKN